MQQWVDVGQCSEFQTVWGCVGLSVLRLTGRLGVHGLLVDHGAAVSARLGISRSTKACLLPYPVRANAVQA